MLPVPLPRVQEFFLHGGLTFGLRVRLAPWSRGEGILDSIAPRRSDWMARRVGIKEFEVEETGADEEQYNGREGTSSESSRIGERKHGRKCSQRNQQRPLHAPNDDIETHLEQSTRRHAEVTPAWISREDLGPTYLDRRSVQQGLLASLGRAACLSNPPCANSGVGQADLAPCKIAQLTSKQAMNSNH